MIRNRMNALKAFLYGYFVNFIKLGGLPFKTVKSLVK